MTGHDGAEQGGQHERNLQFKSQKLNMMKFMNSIKMVMLKL
jgi:hypothetical protein